MACPTRMEAMTTAGNGACVCGGAWPNLAMACLNLNGICAPELCHTILEALKAGRSASTPVIVLAGQSGGEGKSLFLKPLHHVFSGDGFVCGITKESGHVPLFDFPKAKVAFLDEYRFDPDLLSWSSMCLWFDGSAAPTGRPQNSSGVSGNMMYKGTAPIFITTKLADLQWLESQGQ
eukprot:3948402-Karenia_brevis.AAC.1